MSMTEGEETTVPTLQSISSRDSSVSNSAWRICNQKMPKDEVVFLCQVLVLFTVLCCSLYNLTTKDEKSPLWISLLNASIFVMCPNPSLGRSAKHQGPKP